MSRPIKGDSDKLSAVLPPVRCTAKEKEIIRGTSKRSGLSMSEYVRRMALHGQVKIRQSKVDFETSQQLRKIGININQQTKHFNSTGDMPPELRKLWTKLDRLITTIMEKL